MTSLCSREMSDVLLRVSLRDYNKLLERIIIIWVSLKVKDLTLLAFLNCRSVEVLLIHRVYSDAGF